ncbi:MAG TPA: formylglycine-generating enzyme family protein [Sphingobacteriaceae bacterium]
MVSGQTRAAGAGKVDMVKIPGGTYTRFLVDKDGDKVSVKPFLLDVRAVTNQEFLQFVKANPAWARSKVSRLYADGGYLKHWKNDFTFPEALKNSPVTNVSWHAARAYSKWKGKRLPTMVDWEYAGGGRMLNSRQPVEKLILGWYSKPTPKVLPPVRSTYQNEYKVFDMHGLIWEWVSDFNSVIMDGDSRSSSAINKDLFCASGSYSSMDKTNYAGFMRFAFRGSLKARYTVNNLGFRCAADIK